MAARRPKTRTPDPDRFATFLRRFLTAAVFRAGYAAWPQKGSGTAPRRLAWALHPLLLVTVLFVYLPKPNDIAPAFTTARACYIALRHSRKRPGTTLAGWTKALQRLPTVVRTALIAAVRVLVMHALVDYWSGAAGLPFVLFTCDGTRLACPRTADLERGLGRCGTPGRRKAKNAQAKNAQAKNAQAPVAARDWSLPQLWATVLVHLPTGVPYAWRTGPGTASETDHLRQLLAELPPLALIVADAGYHGYQLWRAIIDGHRNFLIRLSSHTELLTLQQQPLRGRQEGAEVYYWPQDAQGRGDPPLHGRLLRLRTKGPGKQRQEVWLLTNVLDPERLTLAQAGFAYRQRWGVEVFFRTYKRTIGQVKLHLRSTALVYPEAELSLLATQLLLVQGFLAVQPRQRQAKLSAGTGGGPKPAGSGSGGGRGSGVAPVWRPCSPRQVLEVFRRAIGELARPPRLHWTAELQAAWQEERPRTSAKNDQAWPQARTHKPPKPPRFRKLTQAEHRQVTEALQAAKEQQSRTSNHEANPEKIKA